MTDFDYLAMDTTYCIGTEDAFADYIENLLKMNPVTITNGNDTRMISSSAEFDDHDHDAYVEYINNELDNLITQFDAPPIASGWDI